MTPGPLDAFISGLAHELRRRGLHDERMLEEARAHLLDAVEDGRRRGLSAEEAEREALERFGSPETIVAQIAPGRHQMVNRLGVVLDRLWRRKWWILAPTAVTAIVTSVLSFYFLPTRYRSESVIHIVAPRGPVDDAPSATSERSRARAHLIHERILTAARLEWIIKDFGLYETERERASLGDVIMKMRRDITVNLVAPDPVGEDIVAGVSVSFESPNAQLAKTITERLARLFVEENLRERESQDDGMLQFVDSEIDDVRRRFVELERSLATLRTQRGGEPMSQADLLPYEVLRDRYRQLLVRREEIRSVANLERRQAGEQYKIAEPARVPERPVGPSRFGVNLTGAMAGFGLGLVLVGVRGRSSNDR